VDDLPAAVELSTEAGWNQTIDDWRMLIERDPEACFGIDLEGQLAATTTLVSYGTELGWIGMVLTRERFQRRGCARLLLEHTIGLANARGVQTLKLDATEFGVPLYSSLGFAEEQPVERWRCERPPMPGAVPEQLDREAFGADRSDLLHSLIGRGHLTTCDGAYAIARPGRVARYLGPCVASNRAAAQKVIEMAIQRGGVWFWDLLSRNSAAVEIAGELGFVPVRRLLRMSRGKELRARKERIFALGGFELG
jgi:GNAT superfamily N-acetyltransferase